MSLYLGKQEVPGVSFGSGTNNHDTLINRNLPDQHPIEAITGLAQALAEKQPIGDYATKLDLANKLNKSGYIPNKNLVTDGNGNIVEEDKPSCVGQKGTGKNSEVFNGVPFENATGDYSHAEGWGTKASGNFSHAEGAGTEAHWDNQHVQGKYNLVDKHNMYAHVVGNGTFYDRSNAHTLDWQGNSWYQGSVLVAGENMDAPDAELNSTSVVIKSSTPGSTKRFRISVDNSGTIRATDIESGSEVAVLLDTPENIQRIADAVVAKMSGVKMNDNEGRKEVR